MILIYLILILPVVVIGYLLYRFWGTLRKTKTLWLILTIIGICVAVTIFVTIYGLQL